VDSSSTITLTGQSGTSYAFEVFPLLATLPPLPAVYFVYEQPLNTSDAQSRYAVYVGHSNDAASCMDDHHRQCYLANRATHVALHVEYDQASRAQKVSDLMRALRPVCNA
jgi:hypothetical protein